MMTGTVGSYYSGSGSSQKPRVSKLIGESPKKKQKLSLQKLKNVTSGSRCVAIGELLKFPQVKDDTVVKSDTARQLSSPSVVIRCVVTDNRVGRLPRTEKGKEGNRFVYIADYTDFMSIGVDGSETGVKQYDLPEEDCVENARLFYSVEITGTVAWVPTKKKPDKPTFFLNDASIKKINSVSWDDKYNISFPTSDVCRMLAKSPFSSSAIFFTTGFCGRVDEIAVKEDRSVLLSLEDPVGYAAVEISLDMSNQAGGSEDPGKQFINFNAIEKGGHVFLKGAVCIGLLDNNAFLKAKACKIVVENIDSGVFQSLRRMDSANTELFMGVLPEEMMD